MLFVKKCLCLVALLVKYYFSDFHIELIEFKILFLFIYYVYFHPAVLCLLG